jgi:hypothetical protein
MARPGHAIAANALADPSKYLPEKGCTAGAHAAVSPKKYRERMSRSITLRKTEPSKTPGTIRRDNDGLMEKGCQGSHATFSAIKARLDAGKEAQQAEKGAPALLPRF